MFSELPSHPAQRFVAVRHEQQEKHPVGLGLGAGGGGAGVGVTHVVDLAGLEDRSYVAPARGPMPRGVQQQVR